MPSTPSAARPDAIRRYNLSLVLEQVHRDGALTRAELTQRLGVSRSTVGALVADLIGLGLVAEVVPSGGTTVGRPSHVVGPHDHGPYVVAVDIDVSRIVTAAVGIGGDVLARDVEPIGTAAADPAQVARAVIDAVERVDLATGRGRPFAVGVSVPGTVHRLTGRVGIAPNLAWQDASFRELLLDLLPAGISVVIGNDADLAVLAEHTRGAARGLDDVVYLIGRVGVGAGIIVNGQPLRGRDGHAGEIGHNVVDAAGPPCHCGKRGCLETYVGEGALLAAAGRQAAVSEAAVAEVLDAARGGDLAAISGVQDVAHYLGRTIAGLVNTFNPQLVLLGGSFSHLLDLARPQIEDALGRFSLEASGAQVLLARPVLGEDAALLGAAEVAFGELLRDPLAAAVTASAS